MLFITKIIEFSAAHRLYNPNFTDEENIQIFDKCNNFYGHGHNYKLEVTISGLPDPNTGYVIDLKKLKQIIIDEIVSKVDHKNLNYDVDFLKGIIPTIENIIFIFWDILKDKIPTGNLYKLKLWETSTSFVEYFGGNVQIKKYNF